MGCRGCGGGKVSGRRKNGVAPPIDLPGRIVLVRYLGDVENGQLPALIKGGTRHRYGTERRLLYIDGEEVSRILAWKLNGEAEFEVVI